MIPRSESPKFLIETDVLAEFLIAPPSSDGLHSDERSLLRQALGVSICYTTMLNVMELFRGAADDREQNVVAAMLCVVRVLGFHARYAKSFAEFAHEIDPMHGRITDREMMILGMARVSKLTIVTKFYFDRYRSLGILNVVNSIPKEMLNVRHSAPLALSTHIAT